MKSGSEGIKSGEWDGVSQRIGAEAGVGAAHGVAVPRKEYADFPWPAVGLIEWVIKNW